MLLWYLKFKLTCMLNFTNILTSKHSHMLKKYMYFMQNEGEKGVFLLSMFSCVPVPTFVNLFLHIIHVMKAYPDVPLSFAWV